jgi:hypothetical protein
MYAGRSGVNLYLYYAIQTEAKVIVKYDHKAIVQPLHCRSFAVGIIS